VTGAEARTRMVDLATNAIGAGAARARRQEYLDLIAPGETARAADDMALMSGCGLVVRGLWRALGLVDPRLEAPYVVGSVITTIRNMADEAGAWAAPPDCAYEDGDVMMLDAPVHVATLVRCDVSGVVYSIDGGGGA